MVSDRFRLNWISFLGSRSVLVAFESDEGPFSKQGAFGASEYIFKKLI